MKPISLLSSLSLLLSATSCFAARPLATDDTDSIAVGALQFDAGSYAFPAILSCGLDAQRVHRISLSAFSSRWA